MHGNSRRTRDCVEKSGQAPRNYIWQMVMFQCPYTQYKASCTHYLKETALHNFNIIYLRSASRYIKSTNNRNILQWKQNKILRRIDLERNRKQNIFAQCGEHAHCVGVYCPKSRWAFSVEAMITEQSAIWDNKCRSKNSRTICNLGRHASESRESTLE